MDSNQSVLGLFHPLVAKWFRQRVGRPTDVQEQAWPKIAAKEHLLVTAPTGSGKTLTAFLWALNQLIVGQWPAAHTSVLYVSPLRALNYDIQRNLIVPLEELKGLFEREGEQFPDIRVLTRSGDTSQSDRREMLRHPPEILITTPESLNLLLSSGGGRSILAHVSTVILDEIHSVFATKRGVYLMTAVDRLVRLSGEFHRIALSATIQPLDEVAGFVGGFRMMNGPGAFRYGARPVSLVCSKAGKSYDLHISYPERGVNGEEWNSVWDPLVSELKKVISRNRSTLIFVNSRRLCEMLTLRINEGEEEPVAYAHHGSLSLEIRAEVERRLKAGALRAIVATNSLELGIDIGALDEAVLVQSPFSISSAIQRVGRSGHQVNQVSRGSLFPTHPKDLLEAAVLVPAILNHDIESFKTVRSPLDVLAQVIVSMVGVEAWDGDDLFSNLRASYPYRNLSREEFDLVLNMLAGRYGESRIRELKPLVSIDRIDNTVSARRGALQTLYLSGGVIPDRGYFHLRHQGTNARIGELDEEFVWEAAIGDTFSFGTQNWQIQRITHNDVLALPVGPKAAAAPFWKGEENGRDFHFSERIGRFLEEADNRLKDPDFVENLRRKNAMDPEAAGELVDFLKKQKEITGCSLPHRHHLVVEFVSAGPGGTPQAVLHTMWGGRVNRPLAMALDAAWQERFSHRPEIYVSNDCITLQLPIEISGKELLSLVGSGNVLTLLRKRLEGSGFFGARFRECAGRALLLPRRGFNQRMPLWLNRLRSQKLLEAVMAYGDFPILLEAWRTCIRDEFDMEGLMQVLMELESGSISWTEAYTSNPSPFARSDMWRQVNQYVYMDDSLKSDKTSRLRETLLREIVFTPGLRPAVSRNVVERFETKRKRLFPGYSPQTSRELFDWVMERVAIPESEWKDLLRAIHRDHGVDPEAFVQEVQGRLVRFYPPGTAEPMLAARETLPQIVRGLYGPERPPRLEPMAGDLEFTMAEGEPEETAALLGQWLQFYGPVTADYVQKTLGLEKERLRMALEDLIDSQEVLQGHLVAGGETDEICDSQNFEILLRVARMDSTPSFEPLGIEWLPLFLADYQGLTRPEDNIDALYVCLERLLCYPAEAGSWEAEILPARLRPYEPSWLDSLMQEGDLLWLGSQGHRVTFCFKSDLDLLEEETAMEAGLSPAEGDQPFIETLPRETGFLQDLFPDTAGHYDFSTLLQVSKGEGQELAKRLWDEVWLGKVTNDTFLALRRVIMSRFNLADMVGEKVNRLYRRVSHHRRLSLVEKRQDPLFAGRWHLVLKPEVSEDLLEAEERRKDRVRLLLDRYGILFRELLHREWPSLRWSHVFRALRIMELSGEVMSGIFFHGIPGLQFVFHHAFQRLRGRLPSDAIYWMNATDPASLCGIQLDSLRGRFPSRLVSTHLVYRGKDLILASKRNGAELDFRIPADDPGLAESFVVLRHLLTRKFQPVRRIVIKTINGEKAMESPYLPALRSCFDVSVDPNEVALFRKTMTDSP